MTYPISFNIQWKAWLSVPRPSNVEQRCKRCNRSGLIIGFRLIPRCQRRARAAALRRIAGFAQDANWAEANEGHSVLAVPILALPLQVWRIVTESVRGHDHHFRRDLITPAPLPASRRDCERLTNSMRYLLKRPTAVVANGPGKTSSMGSFRVMTDSRNWLPIGP